MLQMFLIWLRKNFRDAVIGGVQDALDELQGKHPTTEVADIRERIAALTSKPEAPNVDADDAAGSERAKPGRNGRANRQTA